jgi:hypothetical protein
MRMLFLLSLLLLVSCKMHPRFSAKAEKVAGTVEIYKGKAWVPLKVNNRICEGDSVRTLKISAVDIRFGKNTIRLVENTCIVIKDTLDPQNKRLIAVLNVRGKVISDLKDIKNKGIRYELWTPTSVSHAKGTYFIVNFDPKKYTTDVQVLEGDVVVINPLKPAEPEVVVLPGYYTAVRYNRGPAKIIPLTRRQFEKLQYVIDDDDYDHYVKEYDIPDREEDAPIVIVKEVPVYVENEPSPFRPHGHVEVVAPFILPPPPPCYYVRSEGPSVVSVMPPPLVNINVGFVPFMPVEEPYHVHEVEVYREHEYEREHHDNGWHKGHYKHRGRD